MHFSTLTTISGCIFHPPLFPSLHSYKALGSRSQPEASCKPLQGSYKAVEIPDKDRNHHPTSSLLPARSQDTSPCHLICAISVDDRSPWAGRRSFPDSHQGPGGAMSPGRPSQEPRSALRCWGSTHAAQAISVNWLFARESCSDFGTDALRDQPRPQKEGTTHSEPRRATRPKHRASCPTVHTPQTCAGTAAAASPQTDRHSLPGTQPLPCRLQPSPQKQLPCDLRAEPQVRCAGELHSNGYDKGFNITGFTSSFFYYWSAQHGVSLKASVGVCSKFNYSFLHPDKTDLFDIENTVFTKPVNLVQQQCMVRRRGLKGCERRREINDFRRNSSWETLLSHSMTRHAPHCPRLTKARSPTANNSSPKC